MLTSKETQRQGDEDDSWQGDDSLRDLASGCLAGMELYACLFPSICELETNASPPDDAMQTLQLYALPFDFPINPPLTPTFVQGDSRPPGSTPRRHRLAGLKVDESPHAPRPAQRASLPRRGPRRLPTHRELAWFFIFSRSLQTTLSLTLFMKWTPNRSR